ncbi:hypothetical protein C8R44DRAFT_755154 [Mycena epipterygia]|nr:hypothetical protein C8R44DRAFT_755154 [Mycena epipterygia]
MHRFAVIFYSWYPTKATYRTRTRLRGLIVVYLRETLVRFEPGPRASGDLLLYPWGVENHRDTRCVRRSVPSPSFARGWVSGARNGVDVSVYISCAYNTSKKASTRDINELNLRLTTDPRRHRAHVSENIHVRVDENEVELHAPLLRNPLGGTTHLPTVEIEDRLGTCVCQAGRTLTRLSTPQRDRCAGGPGSRGEPHDVRLREETGVEEAGAYNGMWRGVRWAGGGDNRMANGSSNMCGEGVRRTERMGYGDMHGREGRLSTEAAGRGNERGGQECRLMDTRRCRPVEDAGALTGYTLTGEAPQTQRQREAGKGEAGCGGMGTQQRRTTGHRERDVKVKSSQPLTSTLTNTHAHPKRPSSYLAGGRASGTVPDEDADTRGGRLEEQEDGTQDREMQAQNDS